MKMFSIVVAILSPGAVLLAAAASQPDRPNVVIILADD